MDAVRGESFEACFDSGVAGQTGICSVMVVDNDGAITIPATTVGVLETPPLSGVYCVNLIAPLVIGQYSLVWSVDGSYDPQTVGLDDLFVVNAIAYTPSLPPPAGGDLAGPCSAWASTEDVAACCSVEVLDLALFENVVGQASQLLYELSGRQFAGICEKTVIACQDTCVSCGQVLSRGHVIGPWDWGGGWEGDCCSCGCPPRVKLSGYPVREISEVVIGGVVLDPSAYLLYEHREIARVDGGLWPSCSSVCNAEDENTITYQYGQAPPLTGAAAAAQLACELYKACSAGDDGDCALPTGTTRITRQGITIEKLAFTTWGYTPLRNWNTGLPFLDAFLNAFNAQGNKRRPVFWAPGRRYARPLGQ